jgi:hypothetical protein
LSSLRFPHQNPVCTSLFPIRATFPTHLILLDLLTRIILCKELWFLTDWFAVKFAVLLFVLSVILRKFLVVF